MALENDAQSNLGGSSAVGDEPEIFNDTNDSSVDTGSEDISNDDTTSDSDDAASEGSETESGEGEGAEGSDEGVGDDAEGSEGESSEGTDGADEEGGESKDAQTTGKSAPSTKGTPQVTAKSKPQSEEEKKIEQTLTEAYRDVPKIKEALKQYPELRSHFFKAAQLNKLYPTIREAEQSKEWAMALFDIDKMYFGKTLEGKKQLQKFLWDQSLDRNGKPTGDYEQLQEAFTVDTLQGLDRVLAQNPNLSSMVQTGFKPEQAKVAIEVVRRLMQAAAGRPLNSGAGVGGANREGQQSEPTINLGADAANMTPRERAMAEELSRYRSEATARQTTDLQTAEANFNKSAFNIFWNGDSDNPGVRNEVDKRMPAAYKGNEFFEDAFRTKVLQEIHKQLNADDFFNSQFEAAARSGDRGPEHAAEMADMLKQRAALLIPTIVRELSQKIASRSTVGANRSRGNERPRREPATGGSPGRLTKPAPKPVKKAAVRQTAKTSGDYSRDADRILGIE